eukprot:GHUV01005594.1.p1 GENE.GHUV01005594.1~~GHUV01005594.1.p1  ORF type:complete len:221 (+),score=42.37 GHUV01005594.1:89-751(+)
MRCLQAPGRQTSRISCSSLNGHRRRVHSFYPRRTSSRSVLQFVFCNCMKPTALGAAGVSAAAAYNQMLSNTSGQQAGQQDQVLVPGELPHGAGPLVSHATSTESTTSTMPPTPADVSLSAAGLSTTPLTTVLEQKAVTDRAYQPTVTKHGGAAALAPAGYTDVPETGAAPAQQAGVPDYYRMGGGGSVMPASAAGAGGVETQPLSAGAAGGMGLANGTAM